MIATPDKGIVLTFGEMLIRLSLNAGGQWITDNKLPFFIGGAELNVATALALWGLQTRYVTAVPDNLMTTELLYYVAEQGIDVSAVHKIGKRLGLFYLSEGADMKHNALIYDREGSAFTELKPGIINWDKVFDGVRWFHFSAICPALSQQTAEVCEEALMAAKQKGITISIDLNYREKLWQYGKKSFQIMPDLVRYCDVVMGNIWAAEKMLGLQITDGFTGAEQNADYIVAALLMSERITEQYPNCKAIANTFRFGDKSGMEYYTTLYAGSTFYKSATYQSADVLNTVGSGDCFMGGLIYGACNNLNPDDTLNYATAAAFSKLFTPGDATNMTVEQIKKMINYEY